MNVYECVGVGASVGVIVGCGEDDGVRVSVWVLMWVRQLGVVQVRVCMGVDASVGATVG